MKPVNADSRTHSLVGSTVRDFRSSWKSFALTDIAFKIIALIVLTPVVGFLFRVLIATSGSAVLSDIDILHFFLGPAGWICGIVVGALWLGIVALEQASLMGIVCATAAKQRLGVLGALRFAAANAWPVIQVTARIVGLTLLTVAPFLAVAAVVYFSLLIEHDINFYLKEKPPVFMVALGIGGVIVVTLVALLLRLFAGWFFALPLVLFEDVRPSDALRRSREKVHGHRRTVLAWIVGWVLAMTALSALTTGIVGAIGHLLIPGATGSLPLLAVAIGGTLLLWTVVSLAVSLLSTTTFSAMLFNLYRQYGCDGSVSTSQLRVAGKAASGMRFASFVDRSFVRAAHNNGKEVFVWTVNDAPTMSAMIGRGVDGLLTDKPALARTVLEQRAQMSAPERLLLELAGMLGAVPEIGEQ